MLDQANRPVDRTADAQRQGCGADQANGNQQQAGEQAAIATQQHTVVGQFHLDPPQQAVGFIGDQVARQVAMAAKHRQQIARGVVVGALQQVRTVADRRLVEHGRAGVGEGRAIRCEERHGAHVQLLQGLSGDAFQQVGVLAAQRRSHQGGQLLGDHFATLQQLGLQFRELHPGKVAPQQQGHQAGR